MYPSQPGIYVVSRVSLYRHQVASARDELRSLLNKQRIHSFGNDIKDGRALSLLMYAINRDSSNPLDFAMDVRTRRFCA